MTIGCLSGNARSEAVGGTYAYRHRGLKTPFPPDLLEEKAKRDDSIPFSHGSLTDGDDSTMVGWKGGSVAETGVEIVVDLKARYFVDCVVLRQDVRRSGEAGSTSRILSGLSEVEVFARGSEDEPYRLVGRHGEKGHREAIAEEMVSTHVGVEAKELVIHVASFCRNILLKEMEIWGSAPEEPRLFPIPQRMESDAGGGVLKVEDFAGIVVGRGASEDTLFAATLLAEKLAEDFGAEVPVVEEDAAKVRGTVVALGKAGECGLVDADGELKAEKAESYALKVAPKGALLLAPDRRGLIYGAEALLQLLWPAGEAPACRIEDYPRMESRGVHIFMPPREEIPFLKRLIRYVLAPMRMNTFFLQVTAGMKFDRRPEINETWERVNREAAQGKSPHIPHREICGGSYLTKEEVKDLVDYAREYGFEVIPEIQSLSHVQYLTATYPEIAERPDDTYPDSYCPLNPESHKIVFDMIDEVAEVFGPLRCISMGHDEVYTMGVCERCKGKSRAELFAHDVNKIHAYLKSKGLGMMVWADMLHPFLQYGAPEAIEKIPKDIVMLDFVWYFRPEEDIEDVLLDHGFKVIMGNFYSSHYTRFTSRSAKEGVIGAEVSTWCRADEDTLGAKGKIYDFVYSANMIWTGHYADELRWTLDRKISRLMPRIRSRLRGQTYPSQVEKKECFPIELKYTTSLRDLTGCEGGFDLESLPGGEVTLWGIRFRFSDGLLVVGNKEARNGGLPEEVEVPVGEKFDSLVFLHACTKDSQYAGPSGTAIGQYRILYEDGSSSDVAVVYGWNVTEWNRRHGRPMPHFSHRHSGYIGTYPADPVWQGKTAAGSDAALCGFEWVNPSPEKELKAVRVCASNAATDSSLILAALTGVNRA